MNSFSSRKTLFLLFALIAITSVAAGPACKYLCSSRCLQIISTTNPSPGRFLVTVSALACKGAAVSWIECQNTGCAAVNCDGTQGNGIKCEEVLNAVFSFNTNLDARNPIFFMHDGVGDGNVDCASLGRRDCGGSCNVGGAEPISHVCRFDGYDVFTPPECSVDADCVANGLCDQALCRSGKCVHTRRPNGYVCRPSAGPCEIESHCSGTSDACPAQNQFQASTYTCRQAAPSDPCDVDEFCTGNSAECPEDRFKPAGTPCRDAPTPDCEHATCNGNSGTCPPNICTPQCDTDEQCLPNSLGQCDAVTCENHVCVHHHKPSTEVCRPVAGECDEEEYCTGSSYDCPRDMFLPESVVCRPATTNCDIADYCTGTTASCPPDRIYAAETICRAATGLCSEPARCDGSTKTCPSNPLKTAGTVCREVVFGSDRTTCDLPERCDGMSINCPADTEHAPQGTPCRPSAGNCDIEEVCSGTSKVCPDNAFSPASTECVSHAVRPDGTICDLYFMCTGNSASCPAGSCPSTSTCAIDFYGCCRPYGPGGINENPDVVVTCDFPDFQRDDHFCQRYYRCDNGQRIQMDCPIATHADGHGNCIWPEEDGGRICQNVPLPPASEAADFSACLDAQHKLGRMTGDVTDVTKYYYCDTTGTVWAEFCPAGKFFHVDHQKCEWEPSSGYCNDGDFKASDICEKYYHCANGVWILSSCGDGLDWNPQANACDYYNAYLTECTHAYDHLNPPARCADGERKAHETFCENYYECSNGVWLLRECEHKWKYDPEAKFCKIRNLVTGTCTDKYPDACSDGDLMKDLHKCRQFYKCIYSDWVKMFCCEGYYDEELGQCNNQAAVLEKRAECATSDDTVDADARLFNDECLNSGTLTLADKYPALSDFIHFNAAQKDRVRFVTHTLSAQDCKAAWEPSRHPFECHKFIECQGDNMPIISCPPGYNWVKDQYWGGSCVVAAPCSGYCGDPATKYIPFSFNEVATRDPPCDGPCTCVQNDAIVSAFDADDNDNDQFTYCVNHIEYRVYCCSGTVLNPVTQKCEDPSGSPP